MTIPPQPRPGPLHVTDAGIGSPAPHGAQPADLSQYYSEHWLRLCASNDPVAISARALLKATAEAPEDRAPNMHPASATARKGSDRGRVSVGLRLHTDVYDQLRAMAYRERVPMQILLEQALALLFQSRQQG